jgi:hypothetical protein
MRAQPNTCVFGTLFLRCVVGYGYYPSLRVLLPRWSWIVAQLRRIPYHVSVIHDANVNRHLKPAEFGFRQDRIIAHVGQICAPRTAQKGPLCFEAFSSLAQGHN